MDLQDELKIGDEINVKWNDGSITYSSHTKVFNVADVYFTTTDGHAIFYKDVVFCHVQKHFKF